MKKILTIALALLGISSAWAQLPDYYNGVWYSLRDDAERANDGIGNNAVPENVVPPTKGVIYVDWKKDKLTLTYPGFDLWIDGTDNAHRIAYSNATRNEHTSYETAQGTIAEDATSVTVYFHCTTSGKGHIRNIRVPMANHIRLTEGVIGTSDKNAELAATEFGATSAAYHIDLRSFLTSGTSIRYESNNAEFHFGENVLTKSFDVKANACAFTGGTADCAATNTQLGNPDNYEVDVYFTPSENKQGSSTATITIYDGSTKRATLTLTAKVLPRYFFKATAASVGVEADVKASFEKNVFENVSATSSALAANADAKNASITAYYSAPASVGDYTFKGWYDNAELEGESLSPANVFTTTITATSIEEANPTETVLYAKYDLVRKAEFFGDEENNVKVDSVYQVVYRSTSPDEASVDPEADFWYEILNNTPAEDLNREGSTHPDEIISYNPATREVTAHNVGTATIVFHQKAVPAIDLEAAEKSYTFNVTKRETQFTWGVASANYNTVVENFFVTNNTDVECEIEHSDKVAAELIGSNLVVYNKVSVSSVTINVVQKENYKWTANSGSKTISLSKKATHVEISMNESIYNALKGETSGSQSWDGSIKVGNNGAGDGFDWSEKFVVIGPFEGIPDILSCDYSCSNASTGRDWKIYESVDGKNWGAPILDSGSAGSFNHALQPTTRYLKFFWGGNYAGYYSNVKITELKQFDVVENLDLGEAELESENLEKSFVFKHANAGYNVTVTLEEEGETKHFAVDHTIIPNTGGERIGEETITVTYSLSEVGTHNAKIIISDQIGNKKEVKLTGKTNPIIPVISEAPVASALTYGQALSASELSGGVVDTEGTFAWEDATIVPNAGNPEYNVVFTPTDNVRYATAVVKVSVAVAKASQSIVLEEELPSELNVDEDLYQIAAYATSGLDLSFSSSNEEVTTVSATGLVSVVHRPGEVVITISQEGNDNYEPAESIVWNLQIVGSGETGVAETAMKNDKAVKIMVNGQVFILRGGKTYTVSGMLVE